jgi:hypothetical protein
MSFDLTNKNIQDTFQNLLQQTGSTGEVYDLEGNQVTDLSLTNISASGNISSSGGLIASYGQFDSVVQLNEVTYLQNIFETERRFGAQDEVLNTYSGKSHTFKTGSTQIALINSDGLTVKHGNISGSSTSTGSFGHIKINGENIKTFISSSVAADGFSGGNGGGGGISNIVDDTTPQLGGDLDLNNNIITGSGKIKVTTSDTNDFFLLKSGSLDSLKVNGEGVLQLGGFTFQPTAVRGGIYYNENEDEFFIGKNN